MGVFAVFGWVLLACAMPDLAPRTLSMDRHAPDLFVALVAYLALRSDGLDVVPWAIAIGVAQDCASLDPLGTHAFVLGFVGFVFARREGASSRARVRGPGLGITIAGAALLAHVLYVVRMIPVLRVGPSFVGLLAGAPAALWTAVFAWPLLALLDRAHAFDGVTGRPRGLPA